MTQFSQKNGPAVLQDWRGAVWHFALPSQTGLIHPHTRLNPNDRLSYGSRGVRISVVEL